MTAVESDTYIVHMDKSAMPKAFSGQHNWYLAILNSLSGFSASLSPEELEALKNTPGYVSSIRDSPVKLDTTHSSQFLGLNYNSGAWPVSSFGKDVIIGVVDTGVWPESESFNDDGMTEIPSRWKGECESGTQFNSSSCNKKLIGARFFNKGLIANNPNLTIQMNSPRDTDGHGTHTSSTAAGNYVRNASYFGYATGTASGMAPKARVAIYKAIWDEGNSASDLIAAIDQAIIDGVDVLSLSLGQDHLELYNDPIAIATFAAVEKNIFVSTSAGNHGPRFGILHNGNPWVLTVAAGTMDRELGAVLTLGNKVSVWGWSQYPGNFTSSTQLPIVFMDKCDDRTEWNKLRKKIVVCEDKNNLIGAQIFNMLDANVTGGVLISNSSDADVWYQSPFPAIFLTPKDGETVKDYIKRNAKPSATMEFQKTSLGTKPAPIVAMYSSRGPFLGCPYVLKPDIMAPGTFVLASWPEIIHSARLRSNVLYGKFNILSGTSMACPHAAGVAALLKGAHPEWSPAAIRSAMMTTSDSIDNTGRSIKDIGNNYLTASPLAMGTGHINPNKALDPGLIYDATIEDYVNLLCALNFTSNQIQTITKSSSNNCSSPSLDLNYPSFIAFFNTNDSKSNSKTVKEFQRTVTNVGIGMSTYTATLTPMEGFKVSITPEKLIFKEKNEKQSYKVTIEGPRKMEDSVVFGYLSWVEAGGKHVVRSPIVATSMKLDK
ncbi:hypothetical protein SLEP1_g16746 [Rubroshorea leprosula]|uniref:Uncharacterized protein n=1 Tax=Rubroshorea leprosula TaxID=152421 RepID=A0AAV5J2C7_9ROSI|nr:hypothetical protein SLEP1_g16746 [Rubroshorea leprosula]